MSRVLDELRRDHRNMAKILAILVEQVQRIRDGLTADLELVERAMDYSLDYPDLCHHPKENLIFERVVRRDPAARVQVDRLLEEHREIAKASRRFADAAHQVALDLDVPRSRFVDVANAHITLNQRHIREEEAVLFPLAETLLSDDDWAEIDAAAPHRPDPVFGGTMEDRYLSLHQRILQLSD